MEFKMFQTSCYPLSLSWAIKGLSFGVRKWEPYQRPNIPPFPHFSSLYLLLCLLSFSLSPSITLAHSSQSHRPALLLQSGNGLYHSSSLAPPLGQIGESLPWHSLIVLPQQFSPFISPVPMLACPSCLSMSQCELTSYVRIKSTCCFLLLSHCWSAVS